MIERGKRKEKIADDLKGSEGTSNKVCNLRLVK